MITGNKMPIRILVADDDRTTRLVLRGLLEGWGHEVLEASDGAEARELLLGRNPPHVAVLDWSMPAPDGLELCRELAADTGRPLIYRILLTVRWGRLHRLTGLEAGAHDFITKPADPDALQARVLVGARLVAADRTRREQEERIQQYQRELERKVMERTADLRQLTDKLRGERQRLFDLLNSLPGYVCVIDRSFRISYCNGPFISLFGEPGDDTCFSVIRDKSVPCEGCRVSTESSRSRVHIIHDPRGRTFQAFPK